MQWLSRPDVEVPLQTPPPPHPTPPPKQKKAWLPVPGQEKAHQGQLKRDQNREKLNEGQH